MKWIIDMDGVITSNPDFFKWWTYQLKKKGNNNHVDILTGRNPSRVKETEDELKHWGISYDQLYFMSELAHRSLASQANFKLAIVNSIKPDVWVDNDFKIYKTVLSLDLDELCPGVERIQI